MGKADKRARKRENQQRARQAREAAAKKAKQRRQFGIGAVAIVLVVGAGVTFVGYRIMVMTGRIDDLPRAIPGGAS